MLGDGGVHDEGSVRRRQAVVAPLAGEHGDQLLVLREAFEHGAGAHEAFLRHPEAPQRLVDAGDARRHGLAGEIGLHAVADLQHQPEVGVDGLGFVGEMLLQFGGEVLLAGDEVVVLVAEDDAVVAGVHRRPFELAVADHVEDAAQWRVRLVHLADVVHAHVPLIALTLVGVREAAGGVVLLQHADLAAQARQQRGAAQAADAGADDEDVVVACGATGPVALAGSFHAASPGLARTLTQRRQPQPAQCFASPLP